MINVHDKLLTQCDESELFLMLHIAKHMGKDLTAFPKNETLCEATNWDIKKLQRVKKRCIEKGLISSTSQRKNGMQIQNLYTVKTDLLSVFVTLKDKGDTPTPKWDMRLPQNGIPRLPQNGTTEVLTNIQVLNTADSNESAASAYSFEQFWQDYGFKRGSKAKACERFRKLAGRDLEDLRKALPLYLRETVTKETGNQRGAEWKAKRKYPEFFLSGRIWEAYLDQAAESAAQDAIQTPHDEAYRQYLAWVNKSYPVLTAETKQLSKAQYIQYKTDYYVQGKSWMGEDMERKYLIQAHDQMSSDPIKRATYPDVFALHCEFVQRHVKNHTV